MGKRYFELSSVISFGKYKKMTIEQIATFNAQYIVWIQKNNGWFELSEEARKHVVSVYRSDLKQISNIQEGWAWGFGEKARQVSQKRNRKLYNLEFHARRSAGIED